MPFASPSVTVSPMPYLSRSSFFFLIVVVVTELFAGW